MRIKSHYVLLFAIFFLASCGGGGGGGGGGGTTPSTVTTYHLYDDGVYDVGYFISFTLIGSSNTGENAEGSLSTATRATETIDGILAIPRETYMELRNITTGAFSSDLITSYIDADTHEPIKQISLNTGIEWAPTSISKLPDMAEIGDFGELTSWASNDGRTLTETWLLEDAGNNLANLVTTETIKLSNGDTESVTEEIVTIDETGDPLRGSIEIWYPDTGFVITLNGTRTN